MLTKQDLDQIKEILKEFKEELTSDMGSEITSAKEELDASIRLVRMDLSNRIDKVEKRLKKIETDVRYIKKNVSVAIKTFDEDLIKHRKRLDELEKN